MFSLNKMQLMEKKSQTFTVLRYMYYYVFQWINAYYYRTLYKHVFINGRISLSAI